MDTLGSDVGRPTIDGEAFDLAILADGGWSKLRRYVTSTMPEYAGYVCWRGQIDAANLLGGFDDFGIYKKGVFDTIVLPCCKDDGHDLVIGGMFIATPAEEAYRPKAGANRHVGSDEQATNAPPVPDWFLPLYRQQFGAHADGALVRLFEAFARHGELKAHPQYDYAADKISAGRVILVGDAAHMASPRTAAGAHSAVLDAAALREAFGATNNIDEAVKRYSRGALERARALHMRSVDVRRQFLPAEGMAAVQSPAKLVVGG